MIKKLFSSQLRINMASGVLSTGMYALVAMISYPLYLHYLGYETYGVWLILSIAFTVSQVSSLGIAPAVLKLAAEEYGHADNQAIRSYVATAIAAVCVIGSVVLITILLFKRDVIGFFRIGGENELAAVSLLPYMTILSVYGLIVGVYSALVSGIGRMDISNYCDLTGRVMALGMSFIFLYRGCGIWSLFIGLALSYGIMHLVLIYSITRLSKVGIIFSFQDINMRCLKRLIAFGSGIAGGSFINMLISPFNKLILSRYAGVATVPVFEIAFSGALYARSIIEAIVRAVAPEVSRASAVLGEEGIFRIKVMYRRVMGLVGMIGIPFFGLLIICAEPLLRLWLGSRFTGDITVAFQLCAAGFLISALGLPAYYLLMGLGNSRAIFFGQAIQSVTNCMMVSLIVLFSGAISINGMSFMVALSLSFAAIYLVVQNRREMRLLTNRNK
jgi:O-antigen/teichoic acid export membrane protein